MIVGMDFGTTNSGMATYDGTAVNVLPIDPSNSNPRVARTAIYVTTDHAVHIGRAAIDRYFEHNVGRAVKMRRVWVGELEIFGGDMYYVTDAYVFVDVLAPGRLFLSIKTGLRSEDYPGTVVGQQYYSLENIIATYLTTTKIRAEQQLGKTVNEVVLGRPVRFAFDAKKDRLAQGRLMRAAFQAGYEKVYFQQEPIAAAYSYEATLDKPENVLVFDFGGGTLDVTVMRLGDRQKRQVLATGGIPIAGDVFDQKLVRHKLARHFGEGSPYGPRHKNLAVPGWIYDTMANWQTILELQSSERKQMLQDIAQTARRRYQIEALISLVSNNYGLRMFDIVEQAKRRLSEKRGAQIVLDGPDFDVRDFVTRREFESIIRQEILAIDQHLDEMVEQSGLTLDQIDAVIRTGGSAQIPAFVEMLERKFGSDKIRAIDTFSSVTAGLGITAHGVQAGELDLKAYTPEDDKRPSSAQNPNQANIAPIDLGMVQRRIVATEQGIDEEILDEKVLLALNEEGVVTAVSQPADLLTDSDPIPLAELGIAGSNTQLLLASLDEQLLYITSHYRFILSSGRQQLERQELELELSNLYQMQRQETVVHICRWGEITAHERMLLVTSAGVARPFPVSVMRESIEAPTPLKFDHALDGVVVAALGVESSDEVAIFAQSARAVRYPVRQLRTSGTQAFNCGKADRVVRAVRLAGEQPILAVTEDGYGRLITPAWIPVPDKPNQKGRSLISRREPLTVATTAPSGWLVTSSHLRWLEHENIRHEDSTKTEPIIQLAKNEQLIDSL